MPSPYHVIVDLLAEVCPDRSGMAPNVAAGLIYPLNEAGYTIAILGEPKCAIEPPKADSGHEPPKAFRIDRWTPGCAALEEYVAGVSDYKVAKATFAAATARWPQSAVTLRQGTRVLKER